jgi:hypothetical protein
MSCALHGGDCGRRLRTVCTVDAYALAVGDQAGLDLTGGEAVHAGLRGEHEQ